AVLRRPRPAGAGDGLAAERDRAGVRVVEAGHQPQQRGLAAAGRPEHRGERPRRHVQVHPAQHLGGAERLGDAGEGECRHAVPLLACRVSRYVAGADSATSSAAYGAAAPYARLLLWFQNSVASVRVPSGDSSRVAVSSVTTARNTSAARAVTTARGMNRIA